jgi:hypothetical protein
MKKKEKASEDVKSALKVFEENLLQYTQDPKELIKLSQKLTPKDENLFLEIIFAEYTPSKIQEKLGLKEKETSLDKKKQKVNDLTEIMNPDLVSSVFKEVLMHFKAYKKNPQKFVCKF